MTALRTVLVVDDDAESRRLAVRLLEEIGWRAVEVSDGMAAVELSGRVPLDLVLLDLRLPGGYCPNFAQSGSTGERHTMASTRKGRKGARE